MKQTPTNTIVLIVLVAALLIINVAGFSVLNDKDVKSETLIINNNYTEQIDLSIIEDKLEFLFNEATKDDRLESTAENFVLNEMSTKDFLKDLFSSLSSEDIESYKDIYEIKIKEIEVSLNGDEAEVEVEFNVYYYLDGDNEEKEKALFKAVFDVEELDEDENFEETEATLSSLSLVKIY